MSEQEAEIENKEEIIKKATELLDVWLDMVVRQTEKETFLQSDDPPLEFDDLSHIHEIDMAIRENGGQGLWSDVDFEIVEEEGELKVESFGVPFIPQNPSGAELDEDRRRIYNDVLSDFGVEISYKMDEKLKDWLDKQGTGTSN